MAQFNTTGQSFDAAEFTTAERLAFLTSWGAAQINGDSEEDFNTADISAKNISLVKLKTAGDRVVIENNSGAGVVKLKAANGVEVIELDGVTGIIECVSLNQTSDRDAKENILPYKPNASKIQAFTFDLKEKYGGSKGHVGYVAQDVEKEFPKYVSINDKGRKSLNYTGIHTAKIACLEAEVTELKKLVNKLLKE